jgi:hypothetical protein
MSDTRRRFLQHLSLGGIALGGAPALLGASSPTGAPRARGAVEGTILPPDVAGALHDEQSAQPTFDTTWAQKLTGKYKAVFDVPELNEGSGVFRAGLWRTHYTQLLQATPADLSPVIVIRHNAMPFIMTHEFWDRYDVAAKEKLKHPMNGQETRRNIVNMDASDGMSPVFAGYAIEKQIEAGTIVLGCNMAFSGMVALVREVDKLQGGAAREKAISMMIPGVQLQPNGIFAVTWAQHHGCSFVAAS